MLCGTRVAQRELRSAVTDLHVGGATCALVLVLMMMNLGEAATGSVPRLTAPPAIVGGFATAGFHAIHRNAHAFQSYSGRKTEALQRNVGSAGFLTEN